MINQTFYTELNKKVETYELLSYFNKYIKNYSDLITPKNKLKVAVREDTLREGLFLQVEILRSEKEKIEKSWLLIFVPFIETKICFLFTRTENLLIARWLHQRLQRTFKNNETSDYSQQTTSTGKIFPKTIQR